jgi:hypothetical protein
MHNHDVAGHGKSTSVSCRTPVYRDDAGVRAVAGKWFHVRIVVERPNVTVFVNGASTPCLVIKELSDRSRGSVGLWVGEGSGGNFANLRVTRAR